MFLKCFTNKHTDVNFKAFETFVGFRTDGARRGFCELGTHLSWDAIVVSSIEVARTLAGEDITETPSLLKCTLT